MSAFAAAVDWGTSSFRLWLLDHDGAVLAERRSDDGMMAAREAGFAGVLERHLAAVGARHDLPVIICGMAGARQGWCEADYVDTPAPLDTLIAHAVSVEHDGRDVRILPGIAQRDADWPDVMRGEETQLLGLAPDGGASRLVCLPGTHCKWALLEQGRVTRFATFMTGEFFAALRGHSILRLALEGNREAEPDEPGFRDAVARAFSAPQEAMARLFAVRAGPLLSLHDPQTGAARLSGGLIGLELAGACARFGALESVTLVASGRLGALYAAALKAAGASVVSLDADTAVRAGLFVAAKTLWRG